MERVDQWVASLGFSSKVFTTTISILSSVIVRGSAGARLVEETVEPLGDKTPPPLAHVEKQNEE